MSNKSHPDPNARHRQLAMLLADGLTPDEVQARLGITRRQLHVDTYRARAAGLIPPCKRNVESWARQEWKLRGRQNSLGKMRDIWAGLTEPERVWILRQMPPGLTLAEFIVTVLRDAYYEETQND